MVFPLVEKALPSKVSPGKASSMKFALAAVTVILLSADYSNPTGNVVLATTPLGAKIAVDLNFAAPTVQKASFAAWRGYTGTTGTDQYSGRNTWYKRVSAGTTGANVCHVRVAAGTTLLYIDIEGPNASESNPDSVTYGSYRNCFCVAQVTPYFTSSPNDTVPTVALMGGGSYPASDSASFQAASALSVVGRNMADTQSWVEAHLETLSFPSNRYDIGGYAWSRPLTNPDGNAYLAPYVVFEHAAGIRGRLTDVFNAGIWNLQGNNGIDAGNGLSPGDRVTYGGNTYICLAPYRTDQSNNSTFTAGGSFGAYNNWLNQQSPLIAVRIA